MSGSPARLPPLRLPQQQQRRRRRDDEGEMKRCRCLRAFFASVSSVLIRGEVANAGLSGYLAAANDPIMVSSLPLNDPRSGSQSPVFLRDQSKIRDSLLLYVEDLHQIQRTVLIADRIFKLGPPLQRRLRGMPTDEGREAVEGGGREKGVTSVAVG